MEFGRLPSVEGLSLDLGPEPAWNARRLAGESKPLDLRIGMASWSDPGLKGRLGAGARSDAQGALRTHAAAMPANELNSTFYGYTEERFERWRSAVPQGFLFCPKLPREITHDAGLVDADDSMGRFVSATEALGDGRGHTWFALPPYVEATSFRVLERFLVTWAPRLPLALEVRHESWFQRTVFEDLVVMCADLGVTLILTDTAGRRDVLHMHLTTRTTFVRFVANALHPSDYARLDAWAERLVAWGQAGMERAYFFLHQKVEAHTVDLAEHLEARLTELGHPVLAPWRQEAGYRPPGEQLNLF